MKNLFLFGALLTICLMLLYTPSSAEISEYDKEHRTRHNFRKVLQEQGKEDVGKDDEREVPKEYEEDGKRAMQDPENVEDEETDREIEIPHKDPFYFGCRRRQWLSGRRRHYYVHRYRRRSTLRFLR